LNHPSLDLIEVSGDYTGAELLWHNRVLETSFSYLPAHSVTDVTVELTFRAREPGRLSDLLALDYNYQAEHVNDDLRVSPITLDFKNADVNVTDFMIYPNPTSEAIYIIGPNDTQRYNLAIYSVTGQRLLLRSFQSSLEVKLDRLESKGLHILEINDGTESYFKKIILE